VPENSLSRRSLTTSAVWSVPVVAAAVAAPMAAASVANATLAWGGNASNLATLNLLDTGGTVTATALITRPTQFTLTNGDGAISGETGTVTIIVQRPAGINIPVGRARGFGVSQYNGVATTSGARTAVYQRAAITNLAYGFPLTSFTTTQPITIASNGTLVVPVVFGLAGFSDLLAISAVATFPVTLSVVVAGRTLSATSTITVPVGAGVL
jgi:hypothetical protein